MDRPFEGLKGLFMGRMDRFGYGNDPLGDSLGPPKEKFDHFRHSNDFMNGKKGFFRKKRIISINNQSSLKRRNHFSKRNVLRIK